MFHPAVNRACRVSRWHDHKFMGHRMISTPKNSDAHLPSTWTAGIAILFLAIGLEGATKPLLPEAPIQIAQIDLGDDIMIEEFDAPAATEDELIEPETLEPIEEMEIPPLPEIAQPLTPPEMVELTPLEPTVEKPPVAKPPDPKPRPVERRPSAAKSQPQSRSSGSSGPPNLFAGGGRGRFPKPLYPAAALRAGQQGTVHVEVMVEASGLPSSVTLKKSSGYTLLDGSALDTVRRKWRWPAGATRRPYIYPVIFEIPK
jgi:TonB family protein